MNHRFYRAIAVVGAALAVLLAIPAFAPLAAAASSAPRTGGSLTILGINLSWASTDPIQPIGTSPSLVGTQLSYQNLFTINNQAQIEPLLATGYSYNTSHSVLTITLRHGVKFQDGTAFNAQAVVYNLDRVAAASSGSECVPYFTSVSSITAPTPYKVVITTSTPYSALVDILADEPCTFIASPTAIQTLGTAFAEHPVGTSPWTYSSSEIDSYMTFTRFKGAWQKAYLNSITYSTIGDDQSAIAAVQTNTAQAFSASYDVEDVPIVHGIKNLKLVETPDAEIDQMRLLINKPPFNNIGARRAVAQAIDDAALAKQLYDNEVQPTENLLAPLSWAFDGNRVKGYPQYSPSQAAADVAALPGGTLNFTLDTQNTPNLIQQADAIGAELEAVPGITVTINPLAVTSFLNAEHGETYQAALSAAVSALPDPDFLYYRNFYSSSSNNQDGYTNPAFDSLVTEARETFSQPQRKKLYEEANLLLAQALPIIPIFSTPVLYVTNKRVHNFPAVDTSSADLSQVWLS